MNISEEIARLSQLHASGAITDAEFTSAKQRLIGGIPQSSQGVSFSASDAKTWIVMLHVSQFAGYLLPLAGLVVPILIWQLKNAEMPEIDAHGKIVANWIISCFIYACCCVPLVFVVIGVPLLIVLGLLGIIFPIIGAIKAGDGIVWRYPLSINFFK